jgi:hypothetical protein
LMYDFEPTLENIIKYNASKHLLEINNLAT